MLPIGGRPLLSIWLELLRLHGIAEVLINTHYLAETVQAFAASWSGFPKIHLSHEDRLLGSAGTLQKNRPFISTEDSFLVCNADNLTDINLTQLLKFHQTHSGLLTLALFRTPRPSECGIVEFEETGRVLTFEEKPLIPKSQFANGGIYLMRRDVLSRLPEKNPADIGFDLLPKCLGKMYGWLWDGLLMDIGDPISYLKAQEAWVKTKAGDYSTQLLQGVPL
jgi:mannose-1-phosphate guanylyltransferase